MQTIKNGVFLLLKLSFRKNNYEGCEKKIILQIKIFLLVSLFLTGFLCFSSCKSAPAASDVRAVDLLDGRSGFYMKIPSSIDKNLVARIITSSFEGISDEDAMLVSDRLETVYVGMNKTKRSTEYQISTDCNIPKFAINKIFTKKNGWSSENLFLDVPGKKSDSYKIYSGSFINAAFPSSNIALLGRSVCDMVVSYHNIKYKIENKDDTFVPLDFKVYEWLSSDENEIRFFAVKPQSFLTILTGANLNFKLIFVRGNMVVDPKHENQFLMNMEFEFKDKSYVMMAKSVITLAFGLTDSLLIQETPTNIKVKGIKISKDQLYRLFVL